MDLKTLIEDGEKVVNTSPIHPHPEIITKSLEYLETLKKKCSKNLHVVLMGEVKSGKSTLLNALVWRSSLTSWHNGNYCNNHKCLLW